MHYTQAQHDAVTGDGNMVVTAGAGSGKTRVLVDRYLRLLLNANRHQNIVQNGLQEPTDDPQVITLAPLAPPPDASPFLAITFSEKAAREMRERVRSEIERRAQEAPPHERTYWEDMRVAVESARIGTIHSFCTALLRDHPAEASLDPRFGVLDEVEAGLLLSERVNIALREAVESLDLQIFTMFSPSELRTILIEMINGGTTVRDAVESLPTTPDAADILVEQWHRQIDNERQQAIQAMQEMPLWREACETIIALADSAPPDDLIGKHVRNIATIIEALVVLDKEATSVNLSPIKELSLRGGSKKKWGNADDLQRAKDALTTLREGYRGQEEVLNIAPDPDQDKHVARMILDLVNLYRMAATHYRKAKEERDVLDFDDLIIRTRALLENHPHICRRWHAELQTILVDEFQDTDDYQRAIIYALSGIDQQHRASTPPTPPASTASTSSLPMSLPIFVVGDGKQSIYRFRGADVSVFRAVEEHIVGRGGGQRVSLNTSFRTHPALLTWINQVMERVFARERELLPYEVVFETLTPHRPEAPFETCVELHIVDYPEEQEPSPNTSTGKSTPRRSINALRDEEGKILAARIKALVAGEEGAVVYDHHQEAWRTPEYGDIALLFRASTVFEHYERALQEAGIPYLTTAGRGYYGRKEVQDLINLLYVLSDPLQDFALVGVLRSPLFALRDDTIVWLHAQRRSPEQQGECSLWEVLMRDTLGDDIPHLDPNEAAHLLAARDILRSLHERRGYLSVVELLREALSLTGYMAVISGLSDGERRRANVEKLLQAARHTGIVGLSEFSDYLERLLSAEPREGEAPLEAEGSVRLMTIHRSKGLEFPIVILPDLGRQSPPLRARWMAQPSYGVALQMRDEHGEWQEPLIYKLAKSEEQRMEQAEHERLLYVALTRSRDYLILSGPTADKSRHDWLSLILQSLGYPWEVGGAPKGVSGPMRVWRYDQV